MSVDDRIAERVRTAFADTAGPVGVALSGGGDSVALLHLILSAGLSVEAVTVDHGLRPESADEARSVADLCAKLGVAHQVRLWPEGPGRGNLMDQARRARTGLIREWALARGIGMVALGHTRDDQAETLLMGLARQAGVDGLCGMRDKWHDGGVCFVRPLLTVGREDLRGWLRREGIGWIDDPTNENDRFARVKARRALRDLVPLGITAEGLAKVVSHLESARASLVVQLRDFARHAVHEQAGSLRIDLPALLDAPNELQRRLLVAGILWVSGAEYAPRADPLARVLAAIKSGRDATLWGCRIRTGAELRILREPRAVAKVTCQPDGIWDGRWEMPGTAEPGQELRALGAAGLSACKYWRASGLSREVLVVTPALWAGDELISAPLAGLEAGKKARIVQSFDEFLVSH